MAHHLSHAIRRVNRSLARKLPDSLIQRACQQSGWVDRKRTLGPARTVLLCIMMILRANASLAAARLMAGGGFTAMALCKARARLSLALLDALGELILDRTLKPDLPRVLRVDVCNYYLPDTPALRREYRHPRQKTPRGRRSDYPQIRVLSVFDWNLLSLLPQRQRTSRPPRIKYRGRNYRLLQSRPASQRKVA